MTWRRSEDHSAIAGYDGEVLEDVSGEDLRMVCLRLSELSRLMLEVYAEEHGGRLELQGSGSPTGREKGVG